MIETTTQWVIKQRAKSSIRNDVWWYPITTNRDFLNKEEAIQHVHNFLIPNIPNHDFLVELITTVKAISVNLETVYRTDKESQVCV